MWLKRLMGLGVSKIMIKGLAPLEVSKELKDFVLEFVKNGLDRRFICGSFDLIEKELKVLEVIKNKEVQVAIFLLTNSCIGYNMSRGLLGKDLTEDEYGLLKEVLLWRNTQ